MEHDRNAAKRELEGIRKAYDAAVGYINVSVCDNDTTAEMRQAWQVFDASRNALPADVPKEGQ